MSDSWQPHRLQPTRLLCPWDSSGKNSGGGCHFLLQGIFPTQGSNTHLHVSYIARQILYHRATWDALLTKTYTYFKIFVAPHCILNKVSNFWMSLSTLIWKYSPPFSLLSGSPTPKRFASLYLRFYRTLFQHLTYLAFLFHHSNFYF